MQGRHGRFLEGKTATVADIYQRAAAAGATFYFAKTRQDLGFGNLPSRGSPNMADDKYKDRQTNGIYRGCQVGNCNLRTRIR